MGSNRDDTRQWPSAFLGFTSGSWGGSGHTVSAEVNRETHTFLLRDAGTWTGLARLHYAADRTTAKDGGCLPRCPPDLGQRPN